MVFGEKFVKAISPNPTEIQREQGTSNLVGGKIIESARAIVNYAIGRLPFLVVDENGRVVRPDILHYIQVIHREKHKQLYDELAKIVEAFKAGRVSKEQFLAFQRQLNIPAIDKYDIADALEHFVERGDFNFSDIDKAMNSLPKHLRLLAGIGLAAAKTVLRVNEGAIDELKTYRSSLILELTRDPTTIEAYQILKDRPHLCEFISEYLLMKLGVPKPHPGYIAPPLPEEKQKPNAIVVKDGQYNDKVS